MCLLSTSRPARCAIQVKTCRAAQDFRLSVKDEAAARSPGEWFVFVRLDEQDEKPPRYFVVPRNPSQRADPPRPTGFGSPFQPRTGSPTTTVRSVRVRIDDIWIYKNAWALLNSSDGDQSIRVPSLVYAAYRRYDLPPGHPAHEALRDEPIEKVPASRRDAVILGQLASRPVLAARSKPALQLPEVYFVTRICDGVDRLIPSYAHALCPSAAALR